MTGGVLADLTVDVQTETWPALGTTALVRYLGRPSPRVRAAVEREIDAIDAAASRFRADSELSRLNAAAGAAVAVSPLLLEAVALAVRAAGVTGGAVDPTLGESLISVGYDRDWRQLTAVPDGAPLTPSDRLVVHRRRSALFNEIELYEDPPRIRLPRGVRLDLGATAKALAADRAAEAAHHAGDTGVLVSLGGDIATAGPAPEEGWLIRVTDDHRDGPDAPGQTISIRSGGLATSSIVARRWLHGGHVMHHILDPRHGGPAGGRWRTASVAAATCADANIASTAAIVLGEAAPEWLWEQGLPARLVALDGTVSAQGGWPA
ncbi:MAG TPA: FAD:protein FMN transferase [Solirubrobacteraceae bacterium]|nr:FAD:protein FMN transferase [Solirubrobacteraceae bacterium]